MVDISLNLKKTAAIRELDSWAFIRLIDYYDQNKSRPGYGHKYEQIDGHNAIVINSSGCSGAELKSSFYLETNVAHHKRYRCQKVFQKE